MQTHGTSHVQYDRKMAYAAGRAVEVIKYCWDVRVDLIPSKELRSHCLSVQAFMEKMKQAILEKELTT